MNLGRYDGKWLWSVLNKDKVNLDLVDKRRIIARFNFFIFLKSGECCV